jgi:hypothetical protein
MTIPTEYLLCTDSDLSRLLRNLRRGIFDSIASKQWIDTEIAKVDAEVRRREKLGRNSLIREFRKKIK